MEPKKYLRKKVIFTDKYGEKELGEVVGVVTDPAIIIKRGKDEYTFVIGSPDFNENLKFVEEDR